MAFDQATRNKLQNFVSNARTLLRADFTRQMQNDYGMDPDTGEVSNLDSLPHLNDTQIQTARLLRDTLKHYQTGSSSNDSRETLSRIVREQAFTVLNRLCALRLAETRGILIESIGKGYNSKGFQLYTRVAGTSLGEIGDTYRNYLFSLFDEFAHDLAVLFDRYSPMGRLFPRESALLKLLNKINDVELEALWAEDETIGWIYQYFNSVEERKQMRAESQAPRNSRELAVRNQFFTPRYVVEFLTDNTLGRIWYEMTKGNTVLIDQCRYLVRRPNEIFLEKGEEAPEQKDTDADLSQEELLKQPVYIAHRPIKDPRKILMLDPACGSMHFGLYAFDLFEKIYEEAWDLQSTGHWQGVVNKSHALLTETYATRDELLRDVPRLIIENNIHGIDIDPRAVQIAGLSLWLRAQRSWKEHNVKPGERPQIQKSNIVCAEPMPGDKGILKEFSESLKPKVLGQLLEIIFEKMELAGEAGSLLKIEEEIEEAVENAREEFNKEILRRKEEAGYLPGMAPKRQPTLFDFADLPDKTQFWETAEEKILDALRNYAEQTEEGDSGRRRLFVEDAAKGFAFIDVCRKRFDVVLMNPPFGDASIKTSQYLDLRYKFWSKNLLCPFIIRARKIQKSLGFTGLIFDRTAAIKSSYEDFRKEYIVNNIFVVADTGWKVLDANVETTVHVLSSKKNDEYASFFDVQNSTQDIKCSDILESIINHNNSILCSNSYYLKPVKLEKLPNAVIGYYFDKTIIDLFEKYDSLAISGAQARKGHDFISEEHFRLFWEILCPSNGINNLFTTLYNGAGFSMFYTPIRDVVEYSSFNNRASFSRSTTFRNKSYHMHFGIGYGKRGDILDAHVLCEKSIFTSEGLAITKILKEKALQTLAFLNSIVAQLTINQYCGQHKQVGYVNKLPFPIINKIAKNELLNNVYAIIEIKRKWAAFDETTLEFSHLLFKPHIAKKPFKKLIEDILADYAESFEYLSEKLKKNDWLHIEAVASKKAKQDIFWEYLNQRPNDNLWSDMDTESGEAKLSFLTKQYISHLVGFIYGRWDFQYAMKQKEIPELSDPFDSLPICPPGMLQNSSGLPAEPKDVPDDYPLRITWYGIIVHDEGHPEDITNRVREAIEVIWKNKTSDIEQEACEILNIRSLREYFSKPANFFADHLKRYSKSRRQAPIYWPLSTPSGSYTLWLYYHRLTNQILYTCVNDFVEPKLKLVSETTDHLRKKTGRTSQEEKELEKYSDLELELKDFRDELLRIAKFWKPNLNDGVQITAAPLWKLFQHKPWQKKLKQTWSKLEKGEYDWAHLAYSIWPERVINASHKNRSYAIAHDLEEDLWEGIENGIDRQGNPKYKWVPKDLSDQEIKRIISEKLP